MYKIWCRIYQEGFWLASYLLPWRTPELLEGENSLDELSGLVKRKGIRCVLVVTDSGITSIGLMEGLLNGLREKGIAAAVYDKTVPNPTIDNIEEALRMYHENSCEGIIAFGGGSPMDCAKAVGARVVRPRKSVPQMKGLLKVLKRLPLLFAVPTTAGTGSETTVAAVVANRETHEKYAINDLSLIPHYAVLDPALIVKLPRYMTATTGMDALTHAVEAYIGRSNTKQTKQQSITAVKLIFDNIYEAYSNGANITARANMQKASFLAGLAFTRAFVGYVHAVAHTLGGFYSLPHGLVNAVILPHMLEVYGNVVYKPLSELADAAGIGHAGESDEAKAVQFIEAIKALNEKMNIPDRIKGIDERDIPLMAKRAAAEANPLYPVPKILNERELDNFIRSLME